MKLRYITIICGVVLLSLPVFGQAESAAGAGKSVVESIETAGHIKVNMPERLKERLYSKPEKSETEAEPKETTAEVQPAAASTKPAKHATGKMGGYRIQVFSDSNPSTAKAEARARARNINARFPQFGTYVVYSSPYWRLRVGNFRTQDEANAAAHELKDAFPSYSREIRVVKDRITIEND
ncbi:SPOR domain-containing protein [uncultured Muribaculum sp.]|uniref:SPOR domain-containing protein n=1 Tax=uncultured Muribaculum sp. TaxID=1918613 RepID=UPI00259A46CF|nr:SPOR domain-containing protein [uncultured Muribaculum sp.]